MDGEGEGPLFLLPGNVPLKTTSLEITSRLETESTSIIVETRAGPLQPIATVSGILTYFGFIRIVADPDNFKSDPDPA